MVGKAKTGDWEVTVNSVEATVEADGTFIAEGLSLPEGPNTITASGEDPGTMETDTHEITVTKLPQKDVTYTFDDRGNMTGKTDATGTTNYLWFYTDRLKRIEFPDTTRHRYYYDGLGRRVLSKEDGKDDRRFVYDGWNVIGEKTEGSEEFVAYYTRGADMGGGIGGIISVHRNGTPAQYPDGYHTGDYFYHYNHRGDVVSVTDSTGAEVGHYRYDAYGNVVEKTGDFDSPYQFSMKEYSSDTGLIYYGFRFYMPEEGRWLNKDPLGYIDGWNLYGMVTNNPINFIDPLGLAYIAERPLQGWGIGAGFSPFIGKGYVGVHHQIFFEDYAQQKADPQRYPSNLGLFGDDQVRPDDACAELQKKYKVRNAGFDDALMRQAVENIKKRYGTDWKPTWNCQDFAQDAVNEYFRLQKRQLPKMTVPP